MSCEVYVVNIYKMFTILLRIVYMYIPWKVVNILYKRFNNFNIYCIVIWYKNKFVPQILETHSPNIW